MELELFEKSEDKPMQMGHTSIIYKEVGSILNSTTGFMDSYDYSLNPYSGCSFGCTYCYAAFFARDNHSKKTWGKWVNVKENALELLKKKRNKPLINKNIYISSVTDPYQPIERKLELTRSILKELIDFHEVRIVIQTRSPLCTRDIDLFLKFPSVQVNMTITTDSEKVRKVFEPFCPSNKVRIEAIKNVHEAGVSSCITLTPLLPVENPDTFAQSLLDTGIENYVIQPFHEDKRKFAGGTRDEAMALLNEYNWTMQKYKAVENVIKKYIPNIGIGKEGFKPPS